MVALFATVILLNDWLTAVPFILWSAAVLLKFTTPVLPVVNKEPPLFVQFPPVMFIAKLVELQSSTPEVKAIFPDMVTAALNVTVLLPPAPVFAIVTLAGVFCDKPLPVT